MYPTLYLYSGGHSVVCGARLLPDFTRWRRWRWWGWFNVASRKAADREAFGPQTTDAGLLKTIVGVNL